MAECTGTSTAARRDERATFVAVVEMTTFMVAVVMTTARAAKVATASLVVLVRTPFMAVVEIRLSLPCLGRCFWSAALCA